VLIADAVSTAQSFVQAVFTVYLICIIAYIISSWFPLPYNVWLNRVQRFLYDVVDPYLRIFRRFVPFARFGGLGLDLSPIIAILVLIVLQRVADQAIGSLD
jgi:YggT family protein